MKYVLAGSELIIALIFLALTVEFFSSSGSGSTVDGSQDAVWRFFALIGFLSPFVSAVLLLITGRYWTQLFMLPLFMIVLFFVVM